MTDSILSGIHNPMWLFTLWGTAFTSASKEKQVKQELIQILNSSEESADVRRLAAYSLRFIKEIKKEDQNVILNIAINEPVTSIAYTYILCSALASISKDSLNTVRARYCRKKLKEIAITPGVAGRTEAISIIGEIGGLKDLMQLKAIIREFNRNKLNESPDIAIAASSAILWIDRRQKCAVKANSK